LRADSLVNQPLWRSHPPAVLIAVVGIPALIAIVLVALSLGAPEMVTFPANAPPPDAEDIRAGRAVTITINAQAEGRWRFVSLADGKAHDAPDALDWDLAIRRFNIIANGGPGFAGHAAIADLGPVPFDSATAVASLQWQVTRVARDSTNPAIARWYNYGFTSHLLEPKTNVYLVRTAGGRIARLAILSYYCPGPTPGCMTLRYAFLDASPE
jgi:hypothetical protein